MSHHVPDKIRQPVEEGLHTTDELQVLGLVDPLLNEEDHKTGGDEGHGEDDADGHQHVHRGRHPERRRREFEDEGRRDEGCYLRGYTRAGCHTHSATCDSCSLVRFSG